jgi:L-lactate dehydrogenase (cytochrome)
VEFIPRVLQDVSSVDTSCTLFGTTLNQPFMFAPTEFARMMHHAGEPAVVRVAERRRIAYTLSTMGTTAIEDMRPQLPTRPAGSSCTSHGIASSARP